MSRFRVQHYTKTVTVPAGSNTIGDILVSPNTGLNGLLRGLIITPPASLTGSSYSFTASGYYTVSGLSAGSKSINTVDSHNNPLQFPISANQGDTWLTITVAGDSPATGTLTDGNAVNATDGGTVTIGTTVYRFKNTLAQIGDVKIGGSADATLLSLAKTINGTGVAGTDMFVGTPAHTLVSASSSVTAHAITVTASLETVAGNSIATTSTDASMTWGAATLSGSGEASDRLFSVEAYIER